MQSIILLFMGACIGVLLAASGLLANDESLALVSESVADVNGILIAQNQYERVVKAVSAEKKTALVAADYELILQQLIDEELLVQRGQELGLLQLNRVIRHDIVQAVMASMIADKATQQVSDADLEAFYESD